MAGSYQMLAAWAAVVGVVHAIIYASFSTAARQARKAARVHDLPDWLPAQVGRVRGRASRFILGGAIVAAVAALAAIAADPPWGVAAASFAAGFNLVAFLVEYAGFVSLRRLLAEIQAQADRDRPAPAPAAATPPHDPEPMSI